MQHLQKNRRGAPMAISRRSKKKVLAIRGSERSIVQSVPCSILVCHSKLPTRYLVFRTHPLGLSAANGAAPSRTSKHPAASREEAGSVSPRNPRSGASATPRVPSPPPSASRYAGRDRKESPYTPHFPSPSGSPWDELFSEALHIRG